MAAKPLFKYLLRNSLLLGCGIAVLTLAAPLAHADAALLSLEGTGSAPNATITLGTGPTQQLTAKSDPQGKFAFRNLKYSSEQSLALSVGIPVTTPDRKTITNNLSVNLNPNTGAAIIKGTATRAASIVVNLSAEASQTMVANQNGYFQGTAYSLSGIDSGAMKLTASIVNVNETCCPRQFAPISPVTLTFISVPEQKASAGITSGTVTEYASVDLKSRDFGVSVPADLINKGWINGVREFTNQAVTTVINKSASIGGFFDAKNNVDALRAQQEKTAAAANKSMPSEQVCRFGTMSLGLAASDSLAKANRASLMQVMATRDFGKANTVYSQDPTGQTLARLKQFRTQYCNTEDSNDALSEFCKASKTSDVNLNRDIDYTSAIDAPSTLKFNLNGQSGGDEQAILDMADNLFPPQPVNEVQNADYLNNSIEYRSLQSIRNVAKNSFAAIVAEKASGSPNSGSYMPKLLKTFGVSEDNAKRMIGENPSYYAQMEVLTKRIYQDPSFTINLMDKPENVARQRAAIKAISLQQQRDLLESLQRREMLLSVLLELKIRERAQGVSKRLTSTTGSQ